MMSTKESLACMLCAKTVKLRILANHLQNVHNIEDSKLKQMCKLHLYGCKKFKKHLKKKEQLTEGSRKRFSERTKLLSRFEKAMQEQYCNMDVFTKMLMDVSMQYHGKRLGEDTTKDENKLSSGDDLQLTPSSFKLKINLKEKKVENVVDSVLSKSFVPEIKEKKELENPILSKSLMTDLGKKVKKPRRASLMKTSTPKPKKNLAKATSRTKGG